VAAKRIAEKRYVVKLSDEEREQLNTLIRAGKHPARQLTKARILLKADASEAGEGWRDCEIAAALDTSVDTVRCSDAPATGGRRPRRRPDPQAFARLGKTAHL
jgi:hypothetical protein